jgi:hypothetical protein
MTTIAIPTTVAEILRKATQTTQLVDEQGHLLGSFSPIHALDDELTAEELEEIKRRRHSPGPWLTADELIARIKSRDHD